MFELLIAAWLQTATIREMPGQPGETPLVLAIGVTIPETALWPALARTVACRNLKGEVLTYLLVWSKNEYGMLIPAAFYKEVVTCQDITKKESRYQTRDFPETDSGIFY